MPTSPVARLPLSAAAFLLLTLLFAVAPSAGHAAGIQIASDGIGAVDIAVDDAGTGHVAFAAAQGTNPNYAYDYSYCRIPRGASACDKRVRLATPNNGTPFGRAAVFASGGRVIVAGYVSGGVNTVGTWAWTSPDGGTTWGPAKRVTSADISIADAILGPGTGSMSIVNEVAAASSFVNGAIDGTAPGTKFVVGQTSGGTPIGSEAAVGLLSSTVPFVVLSDGTRTYLRRFDPTKSGYNNPASWLPAQEIAGSSAADAIEVGAAYGPSGAFLSYVDGTYVDGGYRVKVHRINDDGTVGAAVSVGDSNVSPQAQTLAEDGSGRLFTAYVDSSHDARLTYQWSKRGITWSGAIPLSAPGEDWMYDPRIGVAPDGGGWVAARSANFQTAVRVWPIDPKGDLDPGAPTPAPVPSGQPAPTPAPACPAQVQVSANVKAMVRSGACFKDLGKGKLQTTGSVRVNGIDFVAPASGTFTVDTKAHTVTAKGSYSTQVGSIVLRKGDLTWDVTKPTTVPGLSSFGVKLFGLSVAGKADVAFDAKGAAITLNVDLPYPFDAVRGTTTLRATMADGLVVDGITIDAPSVPLGPITFEDLHLAYSGANDSFEGSIGVVLPPAAGQALKASFGLQGGSFSHLELEAGPGFGPLPLPLWEAPPILLSRVGLQAKNDPAQFLVKGGVQLSVGADIAGSAPLAIDALPSSGGGAYLLVPKKGGYAEIGGSGKLTVVDLPIANGHFSIRTDGPVTFGGSTGVDFGFIGVTVTADGAFNLSNGDFYAAGTGSGHFDFVDATGDASVKAIASSIGFAACGDLTLTEKLTGLNSTVGLGFAHPWGGDSSLGSCKYDAYKPASLAGGARASRLQAGPTTIALGGGATRGVRVQGTGGRPGFTFAGPGGRTITVAPGLTQPQVAAGVAAVPVGADAVELQVASPKGSWTLTPASTGPAIGAVLTAAARPDPNVRASVRSAGSARIATITASNLGDQRLIVRERIAGGGVHELGTVKRSGRTTLRFTPAGGRGGRRAIEAVVVSAGRAVDAKQIGSFTAPAPRRLAAPRKVTLKRSASKLGVRWTKVTGAARYRVRVTATDGRREIFTVPGKTTTLSVPGITRDDTVTITVSALDRLGKPGAPRAAKASPRRAA